jgi:hypothetical protein
MADHAILLHCFGGRDLNAFSRQNNSHRTGATDVAYSVFLYLPDPLMTPRITLIPTLFLITTLSACSLWRSYPLPTTAVSVSDLTAANYYAWVDSATDEALVEEHNRLEEVQSPPTPKDRMQLALLLSASKKSTPATELRAMELLSTLDNASQEQDRVESEDYYVFAAVWKLVLQQRVKIRTLTAEIATGRETTEKLQQQIDALTSIEKQLMEREQFAPGD